MGKLGAVMQIQHSTQNDGQALETPASLAQLLNTTPQTILNWFHAGKIPAVIAQGRVIRFNRNDVFDHLSKQAARYAEEWEKGKGERIRKAAKRKKERL